MRERAGHRFSFNRIDFSLLIPVLLLVGLSMATFFSLSPILFQEQIVFLVVSLVAYLVFLNINYRIFGIYSRQIYITMVILLILLFLIGIEVKGAVRWLEIGGLRIQFSEVMKPFTIIFFAAFLSKDDSRSFSKFIIALLLLFPIFFLTLRQPDLGNAIIYLSSIVFMLFMYGFPISYFLGLGTAILIPAPFIFNLLHDYQKQRILSFLNSSQDPFGSSYNSIQSLISIGSGGFMGKGLGSATQSILKFLPERHTDFIFATISENFGFLGAASIIILFLLIMSRIYKISRSIDDQFSYLIVIGFYFLLLTHVLFNIGMNIGILPIVGITLPFVSHGGSSLLTNFIILGILSSIGFEFSHKNTLSID